VIKKHANMHPPIPLSKDTFLNSTGLETVCSIFLFSCHAFGTYNYDYRKSLACSYKYNYNRPRLDQLTQILAEQLIPDFQSKLAQYNRNRRFPAWWQNFKKDWNSVATVDIEPGMVDIMLILTIGCAYAVHI